MKNLHHGEKQISPKFQKPMYHHQFSSPKNSYTKSKTLLHLSRRNHNGNGGGRLAKVNQKVKKLV